MGQVAPSKLHQENNTIDSPSASSSPDLAFDSLNLEDSQYSDSEIQYSKLNHIPMEKDVEESLLGLRSLPDNANSEILSTQSGTDYNHGVVHLPTLQRGICPPKFDMLHPFFRRKSTDTIDSQYPAFSMSSTPKPALPLSLFKDSSLFDFNKSFTNHGSSLSKSQPSSKSTTSREQQLHQEQESTLGIRGVDTETSRKDKFGIPISMDTDSAVPQRKILPLPTALRKQIQRPARTQVNQPSPSSFLQQLMPVSTEFTFTPPPPPTIQNQATNTKTDTIMIHTQEENQPKTPLYIEDSDEEDTCSIMDNGRNVVTNISNNNVSTSSSAPSTLNICNTPTLEKEHSMQSTAQRSKKKGGSSSSLSLFAETSNDTYRQQTSGNSTRRRLNTDNGPHRLALVTFPWEANDNNLDDDDDDWICLFCQYKIFQQEWLAAQRRRTKAAAAAAARKQAGKKASKKGQLTTSIDVNLLNHRAGSSSSNSQVV